MAPRAINVAVLGPGAVGGLVAALLARAGNSVTMLASATTSRLLSEHGIQMKSRLFGDFTVPVQTAQRLEGPVDACFITVKSTQLIEALDRVPRATLADGLVVPLLNGIEHIDLLRATYPPQNVVAATIRVEAIKDEPGVVRQTSPFALVEFAGSTENQDRVDALIDQLRAGGLGVRVRDDETTMLWEKLAFLAPLALLTTQERANAGVIRTRRREDAHAMIRELAAVAAAEGANVDPEPLIRLLDSMPETMESSMQRDQAAGRPLELDAIGGAVIRRASRVRVAVPVTTRLVALLQARTNGPAGEG